MELRDATSNGISLRVPIVLGRDADDPLERVAERALRRIAELVREDGDRRFLLAECALGEAHAPLGQIGERRDPGDGAKSLGEGGPRHGGGLRELSEVPRATRVAMHQPERGRESLVPCGAEPSRLQGTRGPSRAAHPSVSIGVQAQRFAGGLYAVALDGALNARNADGRTVCGGVPGFPLLGGRRKIGPSRGGCTPGRGEESP